MTRDQTRHDRTGDIPLVPEHPDDCDGWINRDSDPAIPCLTCKPHLAKQLRRSGARHTEDQ